MAVVDSGDVVQVGVLKEGIAVAAWLLARRMM